MDIKYNTPHTDTELREIFRKEKLYEKYYPLFINQYTKIYKELYGDYKDFSDEYFDTDGSIQSSSLEVLYMYIEPFLKQIEIGHGEEWADLIADSNEDDDVAFDNAYTTIQVENPELAREELLIHCKYLKSDEHFIRYFLYLFDIQEGSNNPIEKAKRYSETYNKQISLGKSVVFAHEYADLMAWNEYVESYCDAYATAYDQSLQEGKSEDYARRFADMYSDRVGNNYGRLSDALKDRNFAFWHEEMIGNMNGWEYANENNLSDKDWFISLYDNIHINTYYDDVPLPKNHSREEIDKKILGEALERHEKGKVKR